MRVYIQFGQPTRALTLSLLTWLLAPAAHAQLSGSVGVLSNYMYRGVTLSDDLPVARLALNYDGKAGWFAGGQVLSGQLAVETHRSAQWTGYAGYAQRLPSGLSWETGVTAYAFPHNSNWSFREVYAGLAGETISARLHYSPDYLGLGERSLYGELNGGWVLGSRLQAFWHGGYYHSPDNARNSRAEARLGLATSHQAWRAQVSLDLTRLRGSSANLYGVATSGGSGNVYGVTSSGGSTNVYGVTGSGGSAWRHQIVIAVARAF